MEPRPASSGGPAAAGGFEYQKLVTAWATAHLLAETPIASSFELPSVPLTVVRVETEQPVDDLMLITATGGIILAQVKRSLDAGTTPRSQLAGALTQVVRQIIRSRQAPAVARAERLWERALDPGRDRLAIISRSLSAKLGAANRVLRQLRGAPAASLADLATSEEERAALQLLRHHIARLWQVETGGAARDEDLRACLLPLVFVELDVEAAGRDEGVAKMALQHALPDAAQVDACWSELGALAGTLIPGRGGVERSSVQNFLERRGIGIGVAASYRRDIETLQAHGLRTKQTLAAFAALRVGDKKEVRIPRAVVDELVEAVSKTTSLLVTGDPGAGKSGAVHDLAERLAADGHDVVVLAVDRIVAESMAQLRQEIGLDHELVDVLANWPGDRPGYLIIDALDAARARETAQLVRDLLRQLIEAKTRWRVVASIREFDLQNSPQLQALFAGVPPGRHAARAFARLQHVRVRPLTDSELQYLWERAPEFAVVFQHSDARTLDLLRVPFNLRLFADLFTAGVGADELTAIRTRTELLEGYWKWRVLEEADVNGDAREQVLRTIASSMIEHRSLRATRGDLPAVDSAALTRLHSNGVLAPWTVPGTTEPEPAVITFSHHVLFDYAASRLLLRGTPETLVRRLASDPEFILSFRPSAVMHFEYLWLHESTRTAFWASAIAVTAAESLPAIAKTVAPAVAAAAAGSLSDFDPLLRLLPSPPAGVEHTVRHVFGALLAAERGEVALVGTAGGLWAALLRATAEHLTGITAYAIRPTLYDMTEQIDSASDAERRDIWTAAAALLLFARSQPKFDQGLAVQAVRSLCRTYAVDAAATRSLLEPILDPDYFGQTGIEELYWIAREIERIIPVDPEFVRRVYEAAFSYRVLDERQVSLGGGALMNLTTSARQHHESILHSLGESFANFLKGAAETAIRTLPRLLETRHETRSSRWVTDDAEHFSFLGREVEIREDGSYIWNGRSSVGDDDYGPVLHALEDYLADLEPDAAGIALLKLFAATNIAAAGWRQLLRAAARSPARLGRTVIDLAAAKPLLYAQDTTTEAGRFVTAVYPLLSQEERERIERAIQDGAAAGERGRIREYLRDRLLGSIPAPGPVTTEVQSRLAVLADEGGVPPNKELFEITGGAADYTDEDHLASLRVPVKNAETQQLLALTREIEKFTRESLNSVPDHAAVEGILPRLHELDAALRTLQLHDEARDYGWGHLAEAAERIARIPSFDATPFADWIVDRLREGTQQRQPLPEPDSAFKKPAWGSPSARLDAAEGWMRIGRYPRFVDTPYLETVRALARDGAPSVRFHVARDLRGLYQTAPDVLWELVSHFGENENSLGVLQGFLELVQVLSPHHPDRTVPVLLRVLERVPDEKDAREVRDAVLHAIAGLYIWQGNETCEKVIRDTTADFAHRTADASRIAGSCEYALEGDPEAPPDVVAAARRRATVLLNEMLTAAQATMEQGGLDVEVLRNVASFATHIGLAVYRIVGVGREGTSPAADLSDRYARVEPLLGRLATFGVPMLVHYLLSVLETLVPIDPLGMFRLVGAAIESAQRYGYEYESEAVRLIVRVLKRYMADYPDVVRSPDGQKIFLRTLDIFVQVGWPDARRLSYHLEEAFR